MSNTEAVTHRTDAEQSTLSFLWLEITGRCQLECVHCYAESSPRGSHGSMDVDDWLRVIDEAAALGVTMVQFIGGEPTLHPDLARLIDHALAHGIEVEVYSNLANVPSGLWTTLSRPGVRLATSYYSDLADQHEVITGGRGSHGRTLDGIAEALRRDIPLRVGVIGMSDDQRVDEACRQLAELGVAEVGVDHLRQVGRGVRDQEAGLKQLCGNCADGVLAVLPDGTAAPCVFSRWIDVGDVRTDGLAQVVKGRSVAQARAELKAFFASERDQRCRPGCTPNASCNPYCNPSCRPQTRP